MNSKDIIMNKLRENTKHLLEYPDLSALKNNAIKYDDLLATFKKHLEAAGGSMATIAEGETEGEAIARIFPDAKRIALIDVLEEGEEQLPVKPYDPDMLDDQKDINGTDLAILRGEFGVAENGAIWIPQRKRNRSVYFLPEQLAIILSKDELVNNMHEAAERYHLPNYGYGFYMSGPSKTADIESALVIGAHGPRKVVVFITE